MNSNNQFKKIIPSLITIIRIFLAPLFLLTFLNNQIVLSIIIYILAVVTDAIDGYIARAMDYSTSTGAYLDIIADLILVLTGFIAFIIKGIYPIWILIVIGAMFLQFVITSRTKTPVYDPIGKYYGSFLFLVIFITLINSIFNNSFLNVILLILIIIFTIISFISRLFFIIKSNKVKNSK